MPWTGQCAQAVTFRVQSASRDGIIGVLAMPSEPLVSMTPAPADEQETLLREARDVGDRLRLILDINNTIAAHLELVDLLQAVAASLRGALRCDAAAIAVADTQAGALRYHAVDFPESIGVARPG